MCEVLKFTNVKKPAGPGVPEPLFKIFKRPKKDQIFAIFFSICFFVFSVVVLATSNKTKIKIMNNWKQQYEADERNFKLWKNLKRETQLHHLALRSQMMAEKRGEVLSYEDALKLNK